MPTVTTYCDRTDLRSVGAGRRGIGEDASDAEVKAIEDASRFMDGFFRSRFGRPPYVAVGGDVKVNCAAIACWYFMKSKGFNPEGDTVIRLGYEDALSWLKGVANGIITPDITASGSPEGVPTSRARMVSSPSRGWSTRTPGGRGPGGFVGGSE